MTWSFGADYVRIGGSIGSERPITVFAQVVDGLGVTAIEAEFKTLMI